MNEHVKAPGRRVWTLGDLDRLSALGFFGEHERVELIGGELYQMAPKGIRHEVVRGLITRRLNQLLPSPLTLEAEMGWRPSRQIYLEPDILIAPVQKRMPLVDPEHVLLLIEIAKSSLEHDHSLKAETYARLGIRDYWVVDAVTLSTRFHRAPSPDGYGNVEDHAATETLVPLLAPELALRLADLDVGEDDLDDRDP